MTAKQPRKYRAKALVRNHDAGNSEKLNKNISQMLASQAFHEKLKRLAAEFGFRYVNAIAILHSANKSIRSGYASTTAGQRKLAEAAGISLSTFNRTIKAMEEANVVSLWQRRRETSNNRGHNLPENATCLTVITCLKEYADRCAAFIRGALNEKNIQALRRSSLNVKNGLQSLSISTFDCKTGEITGGKYNIKHEHADFMADYSRCLT